MYFPWVIPYLQRKLPDTAGLRTLEDYVDAAHRRGVKIHFLKRIDNPRLRICRGYLPSLAPESLLDVGTGKGYILWYAAEMNPALPLTAVDLSAPRVARINEIAEANGLNLTAQVMDARALAFADGTFDLVTALEVLEHLTEDFTAFRELVRVARRYVLCSFPLEIGSCPDHVRGYDRARVAHLLAAAGNPPHKLTQDRERFYLLVQKG